MIQTQRKINRQEKILSKLDKLGYATREQLRIIMALGGPRNAHRILFDMERENLITSVRRDKKIYYLSSYGKAFIGSRKELKQSHIQHTLMRNDMYIELGMPHNWQPEVPVRFNGQENYLIPDAMFNSEKRFSFIEVDNTQAMKNNYDKIERYSKLFKAMFRQYEEHPTLIWYTLSDVRKQKLEESCIKHGIKFKIY